MSTMTEAFHLTYPILPGLLLALLVGMSIAFSWSPWSHIIAHLRLHSLVNRLGQASLRNVYIPDGMGEEVYLEQLILQPDRLLLVTIKPFRGNIFAAEQIDYWTQVVGHHSYKFQNPLHQLQNELQILQGLFPKVKIEGGVVFAKGCRFPKGKPERVIEYEHLKNSAQLTNAIQPQIQGAWNSILAEAVPAKAMRQSILYRRGDKQRLVLGVCFALCSLAYLFWYLQMLPR